MCYSPTKVARITITCCVLHNICRKNGTPILGPNSADEALDNAEGEDQAQSSTTSALRQRQRLICCTCGHLTFEVLPLHICRLAYTLTLF